MRSLKLPIAIAFLLLSNAAFSQIREKMVYVAKYAFVKGGNAEVIVSDTIYNNKKLTHYYVRGYSTGLTKIMYDVNDIYETILDDKKIIPYKHIRNVKENRYKFYNETTFFHENDSISSTKSGGRKVPSYLLDVLSLYAQLRNNKFLGTLKKGETFSMTIYHADKYFKMKSTYLGTEEINTKIGKKKCHVICPVIDDSKLVSGSDALKLYITADKDRIPVIIELEMTIGKVSGEIISYKKIKQ